MKYWTVDSLSKAGACWEEERLKRWYKKYGVNEVSTLGILELKGIPNFDKLWVFYKDDTITSGVYKEYLYRIMDRIVRKNLLMSSYYSVCNFSLLWMSGRKINSKKVMEVLDVVLAVGGGGFERNWLKFIISGLERIENRNFYGLVDFVDSIYYNICLDGGYLGAREYSQQVKDLVDIFKKYPSVWLKKRYK